jgi:TfoX/Sxy family transcriptional regulator of competence genes
MAYSEELAERIRSVIGPRDGVTERKMFGGIAWMVNGNMAVGTLGEDMMVRLDPADAAAALSEPHVGPMDFTGRPMRGFLTVRAAGITEDEDLAHWIDAGAAHAASLPPKDAAKDR